MSNDENREKNEEKAAVPVQPIIDMGSTVVKNSRGTIHCLTIVGQVEGHTLLPDNLKSTKYEHVLPLLAALEQSEQVDGVLLLLNTVGGDIEAGLAIAELAAGMTKPVVTLVLGGGHSIGIPLAVGVFIPFGLTLNPMFGAAAMSLSSFCVVSNALRLNLCRLYDPKHDHKGNLLPEFHLADQMKEEATMTKTLHVKGMMCGHCRAHVEKALNSIGGVSATVTLTPPEAVVTFTGSPLPTEELQRTVTEQAGDYRLTEIG